MAKRKSASPKASKAKSKEEKELEKREKTQPVEVKTEPAQEVATPKAEETNEERPAASPVVEATDKEAKETPAKKHGFLASFKDFFTEFKLNRQDKASHAKKAEQVEAKKTLAEEKGSIKEPEGKSMIDVFNSEASLDSAVLDTLKDKNLGNKLRQKRLHKENVAASLNSKISSAERFNPDLDKGLTSDQVLQRQGEGLMNKSTKKYTKTYWDIFKDNCLSFFNIILFGIAIALIVFGDYSDLAFAVIMLANVIIGIIQEIRSKKTIDKLRLVTAPTSEVIRDGKTAKIPVEELVIDDLVDIATGDQISADGKIESGTVEVNESVLTGESLPVKKAVGDTVYAGSFVVSGNATEKVGKVAEANWAISLQVRAKQFQKTKSELLRSLNSINRVITLILIPLAICLFVVNYFNTGNDLNLSIRKTAAPVVGMIPAGMLLLTSIALAVGIIRLSKRKTLVQDLYCFEMLARTNTLCLDKTGTLTDGTMEVNEVVVLDKRINLNVVMGSFLNSFKEFNQTSLALASTYPLNSILTPLSSISFSSSRKFSAVSFKDKGTYVLGAPEFVYQASDSELLSVIEDRQKKGYRVVMLAHSDAYIDPVSSSLEGVVTPLALFILVDHIRPEAGPTIKWFQSNGVDIKIISGDSPLTAAEIAKTCGVKDTEKCVSLEGLSLEEVSAIADKYTVFGRVSPEQKAALVKALRIKGRTVGMTGDGVNDILAMKQADCSIAMASGADAAKNVAQLVLLDSNFASMPAVVMEGRRVVNNVQRSSALFLMKTVFTIALAVIFVILGFATMGGSNIAFTYPFTPKNTTLLEFVGIGVPSFFLALQPNNQQIKGNFLHNTFAKAIPGAICLLLVVGITFALTGVMGETFMTDSNEVSENVLTVATLGMTFVAIAMVTYLARPLNIYRSVLLVFLWAVLAIILFAFGALTRDNEAINFFGVNVYDMNAKEVLISVIYIFAAPAFVNFFMNLFNPVPKTKADTQV